MEQDKAGQIVLRVRDGHTPRKAIMYGKYPEKHQAEQLAVFLEKKEWSAEGALTSPSADH